MSEGSARLCLALLVLALVTAALSADLPKLSGGRFWGDGATYYTAAWSLAEDLDLRYEARDALRVRREFESGAQGIFLKRASGGLMFDPGHGFPWLARVPEAAPRIYFAKPFTYPVLAAPFVRLLGSKGLLVANALGLGLALVLAFVELRRRAGPGLALAAAAALVLLTVTPAYLLWPTPEATGVGLAAAGLWAWRARRPLLSALLLGVAVYSKPPNLFLALPLGLEPLLEPGRALPRRALESLGRGLLVVLGALVLYGANVAITGEWNYQGGRERKTFYGTLPFEKHGVTFGNSGIWMSTNQLGPSAEGQAPSSQGQEPPRSAAELRQAFLWNLVYFWVGRFAGVMPYFLPFALAMALFLLLGPRERGGWLALLALVVAWLFYIWMAPDNWFGGSGTLGNRYFLNLLPLGAFLVPRGREWPVAGGGALGALAFTGGMLLHPIDAALSPGEHAKHGLFRLLPAELTMLNDLSVFGEPWRKKRPVGDTEGDPKRPGSADPTAYYLYFPDDGTWGREERAGVTGFWLRGGAPAEVFLRALQPVRRVRVRVVGGPAGDEVSVAAGGRSERVAVGPGEQREVLLDPASGFPYKYTFVHVLRFRSSRGGTPRDHPDTRNLGAFVSMALELTRTAAVDEQARWRDPGPAAMPQQGDQDEAYRQ